MAGNLRLKVEYLSVDKIFPNPWNPNVQNEKMFSKELNSIRQFGFVQPILVRNRKKETVEIIDGEYRWKAAKALEYTEIPVINLGTVKDSVAQRLTPILNYLKGYPDNIKMAQLVKQLEADEELTLDDIYRDLPFDKDEIDGLRSLEEWDWEEGKKDEDENEEETGEGWLRLKFLVSEAQADIINGAIDRIIEGTNLEGKNAEGRALELIAADSLNTPIESYK